MSGAREIRAVLFDLDGTLVDSAPDLLGALAWLRQRHDLEPLDYAALRHHAARGALGIIEAGFKDRPDIDRRYLRRLFIERYADNLWEQSRPFEGIELLLEALRARGLELAVVTNKLGELAVPLVAAAGWRDLFGSIIGGDTVAAPKPHPAPVLEACRRLGVHPGNAIMVGDDIRDIQAGGRAGCLTVAATWGYIVPGEDPYQWDADHVISNPDSLEEIVL